MRTLNYLLAFFIISINSYAQNSSKEDLKAKGLKEQQIYCRLDEYNRAMPCKKSDAQFYRIVTTNKQGYIVGLVKEYYLTGELKAEGEAYWDSNDDKTCYWKNKVTGYYKTGVKEVEKDYGPFEGKAGSYSLKNGKYITWYENGQKETEGSYANGDEQGEFKYYNKEGALIERKEFSRGQCLKTWTLGKPTKIYFDKNGNITNDKLNQEYYRMATFDENGTVIGKVKDYYITGEIKLEGDVAAIDVANNYNANWKGIISSYYKSGKKHQDINYDTIGNINGPSYTWHENGNKKAEVIYAKGKENGPYTLWYENGNKMEEGVYLDGVKTGISIYYSENGNFQSKLQYSNGKLIEKWYTQDKTRTPDGTALCGTCAGSGKVQCDNANVYIQLVGGYTGRRYTNLDNEPDARTVNSYIYKCENGILISDKNSYTEKCKKCTGTGKLQCVKCKGVGRFRIPEHLPNQKIFYYDKDWVSTNFIPDAAFYRVVTFTNGKPDSRIKDYYINGNLRMEAEATYIDNNGNCSNKYKNKAVGYFKTGQKQFEYNFNSNGEFDGLVSNWLEYNVKDDIDEYHGLIANWKACRYYQKAQFSNGQLIRDIGNEEYWGAAAEVMSDLFGDANTSREGICYVKIEESGTVETNSGIKLPKYRVTCANYSLDDDIYFNPGSQSINPGWYDIVGSLFGSEGIFLHDSDIKLAAEKLCGCSE